MPSRLRLREGPIGVRITLGQPTIAVPVSSTSKQAMANESISYGDCAMQITSTENLNLPGAMLIN